MKKRAGILGIATGGLAAIAILGGALAAGFTNGSFENGTNPGVFSNELAGSTDITGWTIVSGNVDYIGTYWTAADGARSIDLNGTNANGVISQAFDTVVGTTYVVEFSLSGNPAGGPAEKTLTVQATGGPLTSYSYNTTTSSTTLGDMKWAPEAYSFVATGISTTLTFSSTTGISSFGPALDNIVITETLRTGADCKKGGWEGMTDGLGNGFKNQGDCVSYFATDGKNLGSIEP